MLSRDTKAMLKHILQKYIEREMQKAIIKACILQEFEIASMQDCVKRKEVHEHVSETLRYPYGNTLIALVKSCMRDLQVHVGTKHGYDRYFGIKKAN